MRRGFEGIMPAIASACNDQDQFVEDKFADLAVHLYEQGAHGLYVCGVTGDGFNMRLDERKRAAEIATEFSRKYGGKVIVHVGTSNTRDAVELAEHAAQVGADAVSSMPPANRSHEQLVSYHTDMSNAARIPLVVYYIPALTGGAATMDQLLELLDIDGVVGLKFSDLDFYFMNRLIAHRPEIVVFIGEEQLFCSGMLYGARGGIGMTYNVFPKLFLAMYEAMRSNMTDSAMELQKRFLNYVELIEKFGVRQSFSAHMRELGFGEHFFRRPRLELEGETHKRFLAELQPIAEAIEEAI